MICKVTFDLDGSGIVYNPSDPIHLDALVVAAAYFQYGAASGAPHATRDSPVADFDAPIRRENINGARVFRASALAPEGPEGSDQRYWRKQFRTCAAELCSTGSVDITTGMHRLHNNPYDLVLCHRMVGWIECERKAVKKLIRLVKAIGARRGSGHGRVVSARIEPSEEDRCVSWEGRATRYYPHPRGLRLVRPRPPYWNVTERVRCLPPGTIIPAA